MLGTSDATASPVKPSSLPPRTASRPPPPQLPPKPPKPAPAPPKPILKTTAPPPPPLVAPTPEPETLPDPPPSPPPLYTGKPIGSEAPLVRSLNAAIKLLSKPPVFFAATAALAVLLAARQLGFRNTLYAAIALSWTLLALMARRRTGPAVAYFTCARESVARELVKEMLELKLVCPHPPQRCIARSCRWRSGRGTRVIYPS
ncbi:hypothetical protein M427DRAFT_339933 [Gonapodya prolifera JEL478]|uniref:Uncharacterized protein n=1 Tax=Gonapodya prolifera (strain JEL478) TaxID=1344416 RepID=A0A139ACV1_GONPJ|nr:hypothetical protein M427DRAFT_339933 [Gonapodya prolifera JEL478]|eukprot:KXS14607.1 hypothetical protein M427DRAFT_339933 [Gonapodya prolifera JEL478]